MPVFIAIGAAIAAAHHYTKKLGSKKDDAPAIDPFLLKGLIPIDLLPSEERFVREHPIRTISFYEGNASDAASILWGRLNEIVHKNSWLCGCLVKGGKEEDIYADRPSIRIWYEESRSAMHPGMFQFYPRGLVHITSTTPYAELESVLDGFDVSVKPNCDILNNKQESLFRVSVIPEHHPCDDSSLGGFALVVSMSSVLGDDYTFFKLYDMLVGSDIVSLDPRRVEQFDIAMKNLMGDIEAEYVAHITADPCWEKIFIHDELETSSQLEGRLFEVSSSWINDIKLSKVQRERKIAHNSLFSCSFQSPVDDLIVTDEEGKAVKELSISDIIVSWFWNVIQPTVGLLEVNLREHVKVAGANHAGNYVNSIAYTQDDYKTVERIHKSLSTFCRAGKNLDPPTILPRVRVNTRFSIVSNHLHFSQPNSIDNELSDKIKTLHSNKFTLVRHLPLYFASALQGVLPKRMSFLHLFQISQEKIGCFVVAPADSISKIDECGIVDELIFGF